MSRFLPLAALAAFLAAAGSAPAQNLVPEKDFYVANDVVEAVEVIGDSLYVGGRFTYVGPYTGSAAPISISTAEPLPSFPQVNDYVYAIEPDGAGGWFLGGDFTEIGGFARANVAHLLPDLTVDPDWNADTDGRVRGFAIHGGRLYMHGYFIRVHGEFRTRIASVDLATGDLTDWNPTGPTGVGIEDFFLDGDTLYVVGAFSEMAGHPRRMAAFDLTTGDLTGFDPDVTNQIRTVVVKDGTVYVGGAFTALGDSTRNRLAAFDAATSELLPWQPSTTGTVVDMALGDTTVYVVGAFSSVNNEIHRAIAEIDLVTGAVANTLQGTTNSLSRLLVHGDKLFVGGDFTTLAGQDRRNLACYDRNTGALLPTPAPLKVVHALAAAGDTLYVGGDFTAVTSVPRNRMALFHANTLELQPWAPDFGSIVWEIEATAGGDTMYVSGRFLTVNGTAREKVCSFDRLTGALTSFHADVSDSDVHDFAITDSLLYIGGSFNTVDGAFRSRLACLDRVTGDLRSWAPAVNGLVYTVAALNDTIYVGGGFLSVGDSARTNLAAVTPGGEVLSWGNAVMVGNPDEVESILPMDHPAYPQGVVFLGGDFLNLGIGLRRGVAALRRDTGNTLYNWQPYLQDSYECEVRDYALADGLLYVAGDFGGVFDHLNKGAAAIDIVTADANPWIVDVGKANAIAISDSMVIVGGYMTKVQGLQMAHLAAFRRDTEPPLPAGNLTATPSAKVDKRIDLAWTASASPDRKDYVVYRTSSAVADTTGRQIAITDQTGVLDIAPTYAEWFYRVWARDGAHNLSAVSNVASAVAPQIVPDAPNVTTAILQNPAATAFADVVVVSDSLLMQPPGVTIVRGADSTDVAMGLLPGAASAYGGAWEIAAAGLHTVRTSVVTAGGNPFAFERSFTATLLRPATGGEARSAGGDAFVSVPAGALAGETWIVVEEDADSDGESTFRFGPPVSLRRAGVVALRLDPAADPGRGTPYLVRLAGDTAVPLPSTVDADAGVVRAVVDRLGTFALRRGPFPGADPAAPLPFAVRAPAPNPFRTRTTIVYDLPGERPVRVAVHDVAGRRVAKLQDAFAPAGTHRVTWDGRDARGVRLAAGVYFVRLTAGTEHRIVKMVLLR
ncbi:T9SS type A sorting domain-containing protein [bacterium]|nr:T9SS type A sorting domain-containing protein [bacterium]